MTEGEVRVRAARVLVVDEEPLRLRASSQLLAGAGYEVVKAASGEEGLRLTRETRPDLVLVEVTLPDIDGPQVCRRIKSDGALATTLVALLSGAEVDTHSQAAVLEEGADEQITRPISNREFLARVRALARMQRVVEKQHSQMHELQERVKELNCLYGISRLSEREDLSLPEILQSTAELMPPAWLYPEITCARIILDDEPYQTPGFQETPWCQSRAIRVQGKRAGKVEVFLREERPVAGDGPFLTEEGDLLDAIAERLGRIVERFRAEEALVRYEIIVGTVTDPISYLGRDYVYRAVNAAYAGYAKRPAAEIVGRSVADLLGSEVFEAEAKPRLDRCLAGEEVHYQAWFPVPGEASKYMDVAYYPVRDPDGQVAGVVVSSRDMTERKEVEEALQRERDLVAQVMDTSPVGIAVFDRQGRMTFANSLLWKMAGQAGVGSLIGRAYNDTAWESITKDGRPFPDEALPFAQVMASGGPVYNIEHDARLPDGMRLCLSSNAAPLFDESGQVDSVVVTTEDITPRRMAEAQLAEAAATAERERIARELHDAVTQNLFSVAAIAEAVPRVWERDPKEARRNLEELRWLTQGALAEMRAMLLELRPAGLSEHRLGLLLRQLTDAMMGRTRMPVTTTIVGECTMPGEVKLALYRIAQEALNNVTKHARASEATVSLHCTPATVRLRISDDGRGFDQDAVRSHHLGLEIMRERARDIGATLTIDSQPGGGTRIDAEWHTP